MWSLSCVLPHTDQLACWNKKPWSVEFADFHGIYISTMANRSVVCGIPELSLGKDVQQHTIV